MGDGILDGETDGVVAGVTDGIMGAVTWHTGCN